MPGYLDEAAGMLDAYLARAGCPPTREGSALVRETEEAR